MTVEQDRRDVGTQRITFEAIVEVGNQTSGGEAFEAESVDVSAGGMHLRTAYLPDLGQPLMCRFTSAEGGEIAAEGNVVWREEGSRGGEFGVRFTNVDSEGAKVLLDMCGVRAVDLEPARLDGPPPSVDKGTRVRLHIDGLGAPMKARVREGSTHRVMVGSNLEFLRVGRNLELEDVDNGGKRAARIQRVDVEVDAASRIPQLVVALAYDGAPDEAIEPARAPVPTDRVAMAPASVPERVRKTEPLPAAPVVSAAMGGSAADEPDEIEHEFMRSGMSRAASKVTPALMALGARAKTTLALLVSKSKGETEELDAMPARRTTAPPPGGGLRAAGKRVVRGEDEDEVDAIAPPRKPKLRAVAIGGAVGAAVVLALLAMRKPHAAPGETTDAQTASATTESGDAGATTTLTGDAGVTFSADTVVATVPMFGPTPLSTTEPAPAIAPAAPGMPGAFAGMPGQPSVPGTVGVMADPMLAASPMLASSDSSSSGDADDGSSKHEGGTTSPSFAHGKVSHPTLLRLHLDGAVTSLHGARTATGFSVTMPGRKSIEAASGLVAKDPRIASARVSNGGKGAELNVQFKDGVPSFWVKGKGHDIVIALGHDKAAGDKSADTKDAKHAAVAKKSGKGAASKSAHKK